MTEEENLTELIPLPQVQTSNSELNALCSWNRCLHAENMNLKSELGVRKALCNLYRKVLVPLNEPEGSGIDTAKRLIALGRAVEEMPIASELRHLEYPEDSDRHWKFAGRSRATHWGATPLEALQAAKEESNK
jgi:hypothetical protein